MTMKHIFDGKSWQLGHADDYASAKQKIQKHYPNSEVVTQKIRSWNEDSVAVKVIGRNRNLRYVYRLSIITAGPNKGKVLVLAIGPKGKW